MNLETTYLIGWVGENFWIQCKLCGLRSFNINDVKYRYCSSCHRYHTPEYVDLEELKKKLKEN